MDFDTGRRRFLELAGTGTAFSLAGCSALQDDAAPQAQTTESETGDAPSSGASRQATVALRADQQALQQRQQEISSELRSGNISRSEAQQQYQTAQQELLSDAVTSFRERAESTESLSIVDSVEQFGVFLVEGPAATILDTLSFDAVNALLSAATFEQARQQAQQSQQGQQTEAATGGGDGTNTTSTATTTSPTSN
ncbi:hypothetical protein [Salinigranum rubrum]|uniref:hypothetical protein n=1 Tax=Salinigranum rubrum TaxID=755307 RepID=UPI001C1F8525|nr:hypothetical protein [Salinigranum rubrum]